jgi:hypothetical protein
MAFGQTTDVRPCSGALPSAGYSSDGLPPHTSIHLPGMGMG